jgi:hypothetical protein
MSKATKRRRPKPAPKWGFTLPHFGVIDCRTAEERARDDAGRAFEHVAAEHPAEEPDDPTREPSRD